MWNNYIAVENEWKIAVWPDHSDIILSEKTASQRRVRVEWYPFHKVHKVQIQLQVLYLGIILSWTISCIAIFWPVFKISWLINFWLCWSFIAARAFSSCREQGYSLAVVFSFLLLVAFNVAEHRLQNPVVVHGLSCPLAYGIFLDRGLNSCPLHCKANS